MRLRHDVSSLAVVATLALVGLLTMFWPLLLLALVGLLLWFARPLWDRGDAVRRTEPRSRRPPVGTIGPEEATDERNDEP